MRYYFRSDTGLWFLTKISFNMLEESNIRGKTETIYTKAIVGYVVSYLDKEATYSEFDSHWLSRTFSLKQKEKI